MISSLKKYILKSEMKIIIYLTPKTTMQMLTLIILVIKMWNVDFLWMYGRGSIYFFYTINLIFTFLKFMAQLKSLFSPTFYNDKAAI